MRHLKAADQMKKKKKITVISTETHISTEEFVQDLRVYIHKCTLHVFFLRLLLQKHINQITKRA